MASVLFTNVRILDGSGAGPHAGEVCCWSMATSVADITVPQKKERILAVMKDGAFHREPGRVSCRARWSLPAA